VLKTFEGKTSMKRLLQALCVALLITALGPASAQAWWWHHHSDPGPAGVGASGKVKRTRSHREKHQRSKTEALYHFPKSVGFWRHDTPGPAGAGAEEGKNQPKQQSARHSSSHKSLFWWRHHDSNSAPSTASGK
jgi:hypothetical protein